MLIATKLWNIIWGSLLYCANESKGYNISHSPVVLLPPAVLEDFRGVEIRLICRRPMASERKWFFSQ